MVKIANRLLEKNTWKIQYFKCEWKEKGWRDWDQAHIKINLDKEHIGQKILY